MRFGLVHRVMTDALAVLGILAVVSTAALGTTTTIALLAGLAVALALPESWQTKPLLRQIGTTGVLLLFIVQVARIFFGHSALDVSIEFAALLQVLRIATRRGAAHDQQIIVLALLHLVAGTVLGGGIAYGLCFLGFLVVAPGALVLSHLRREVEGNYRQGARDRTGLPVDVPRILRSRRVVGRGFLLTTCLLSVPIFAFTATLFVLFPRVGLSLLLLNHPRHGRMVGFSDKVDLGQVGTLRSDPSLALRFELDVPDPPPPRMTLRLRGTAFDAYDGRSWARSSSERRPAERTGRDLYPLVRTPDPIRDRKISFDLEPIDPPVVFLPPKSVAVRVKMQNQALMSDPIALQRGPEGELRYVGADVRGLRYEVYLANDGEVIVEPLPGEERARYLDIPPLPARIAALAHEWADPQPTARLKAKAIEEHLKNDYAYDVTSPSGGTAQPLDHFLFESRRGHCEFFSSAMAVMLRVVGIPSRNVTGFVGGTYNRFGRYYAVREGDAHSWVEAYIDDGPHSGWVTFDPTPTAGAQPLEPTTGTLVYLRDLVEALSQRWNRYVVGYDIQTQVGLFREISRSYESARRRAGLDRGLAGKLTRGPVIAGALLVLGVAGYLAWARRARRTAGAKHSHGTASRKDLEAATVLYRELEGALSAIGASRPSSTPPLRHADSLVQRKHPLAPEVHALTERYLAARFGGEPFSASEAREFRARVKALRSATKPASRSA